MTLETLSIDSEDVLGTNYIVTSLTVSNYNPTIDSTVTVTVTLKDVYNDPVVGEEVLVTASDGTFTQLNGSNITAASSVTGTTNSNGQFTLTYSCTEWGLITFSANNKNMNINVKDKWRVLVNDGLYYVRTKNDVVQFHLAIETNTSFPTSWTAFGGNHVPEGYRPRASVVIWNAGTANLLCRVQTDGTVERKTLNSSQYTGYGYFFAEWTI